jgi:hypothetical protein
MTVRLTISVCDDGRFALLFTEEDNFPVVMFAETSEVLMMISKLTRIISNTVSDEETGFYD